MPSIRCSSSQLGTQRTCKPSDSKVSPCPISTSSSSGSTVRLVKPIQEESRVDCHQRSSASKIYGNNDTTVREAPSVVHTSTNQSGTSDIPWPMWTVSHMMTCRSLAKLISYYRSLKLADHLNDEDLRSFLQEQLCKEKAGLSEVTISMRLRTRVMLLKAGENPETCSICMVEFKDQDSVASLYYCSHEYHTNCIKEWLAKCNLCPMCRALAIIPEIYPSWEADVKLHQAYFVHLHHAKINAKHSL